MEGMAAPYFLSYRVRDFQTYTMTARYGSLTREVESQDRFLYIDLRVGDEARDNSNYFGSWRDVMRRRVGIVEENQYDALRHQFWYHTDRAYKRALENLARKRAYLQSHPVKEETPDFSPADKYEYMGTLANLESAKSITSELLQETGEVFIGYPAIQDWNVEYTAIAINQWYINSEGSKHTKGHLYHSLEVTATAQAEDGQRLSNFLQYITTDAEELPARDELFDDLSHFADELEQMANAEAVDEFVGPVLFTDWAAAQFLSQIMVEQLVLPRDPILPEDWMHQYFPVGKLAGKVKRRLFPDFVSISDEPLRTEWEGTKLAGTQFVDDEGVACQPITLVEKGRLLTLPLGRQPTKKINRSNGHARSTPFQYVLPGITNLVLSTSKPQSMKKMKKELQRVCKEQEAEYGLLIKRLDDPGFTRSYRWSEAEESTESLLTAPVIAYKVYAKDGRMEPVRGLVFDEVTIRTLRDILAVGNDEMVYNMTQYALFEEAKYPASIITPSILVEEMEMKGSSTHEPLPLSANPFFAE
jgi:predicted Zn-dependent protease